MLTALLPLLAVAPIQDRAISVGDVIASFDTQSVRHTASDQLGASIIYLHAPNATTEEIKQEIASALCATWTKADYGFRLARSPKQTSDLRETEIIQRAEAIRRYQDTIRKRLADSDTAEERMTAALQSVVRFQEKYRNTSPSAYKWDTELPTDWVLFSAIASMDAKELASLQFQRPLFLSDKPVGSQRSIGSLIRKALQDYERDRGELIDFAATILNATAGGPMVPDIERKIKQATKPAKFKKAVIAFTRSNETVGAGVYLFSEEGESYDLSVAWIPTQPIATPGLLVPADKAAVYTARQEAFAVPSIGYEYVRSPKPDIVRPMIGVDPLVGVEPFMAALTEVVQEPFFAVLDDKLLGVVVDVGGRGKTLAQFVRLAGEQGLLRQIARDGWSVLRPAYLLDCEARRLDRKALQDFLVKTVDAGFVRIEDHARIVAASGDLPANSCLEAVFSFLNKNGYVLVDQSNYVDVSYRLLADVLNLRGSRLEQPIEINASALSSKGKDLLWKWSRLGLSMLESRPGFTHTALERNADEAMPSGISPNAVIKLTPYTDEFIGLLDNWPLPYEIEGIATFCVWNKKTPEQFLARPFHYGKRRAIKLEAEVRTGLVLTDSFAEASSSTKAMNSFGELPDETKSKLKLAYEEAKKTSGGGEAR